MIILPKQKDESRKKDKKKELPIVPALPRLHKTADQAYLEYNLFTGPHAAATGNIERCKLYER